MTRVWAITVLVAALIIAITGRTAARAYADAGRARTELKTVREQATELVRLRQRSQKESLPAPPSTGLASQISTALAHCGIPASTLQSLSPESQSASGTGCIRKRATLNLAGLTLPQVGAFLAAWRGGDYTVSSIELSPLERTPQASTASPGADLPLRAVITLEGLFRDLPSPAGAPKSPSGAKP